jgi:hypothetical protein
MTAPRFNILTQRPVTIDLSREAMLFAIAALGDCPNIAISGVRWTADIECEIDNFRSLLHNLLDRSEPETGNLDLVGG